MAKESIKEKRKRRKQKRRERKAVRKEQFAKIVEIAKSLKLDFKLEGKASAEFAEDIFKEIWPLLKEVMVFLIILRITGKRADERLQELISSGEKLITGKFDPAKWGKFSVIFAKSWGIVKSTIEFVILFVDDKVAAKLEKVIETGDWIADGL